MDTVTQSDDISADRETATPYVLRRRAEHRAEVEAECARRRLGPDPLAA